MTLQEPESEENESGEEEGELEENEQGEMVRKKKGPWRAMENEQAPAPPGKFLKPKFVGVEGQAGILP